MSSKPDPTGPVPLSLSPSLPAPQAEVAWDGEQLAGRYLARVGRERLIARLQEALRDPDPTAIDQVLKVWARRGVWRSQSLSGGGITKFAAPVHTVEYRRLRQF